MTNEFKEFIEQTYPEGTTNINASVCYQIKIGPSGAKTLVQTITWPIESLNLTLYFIENEGIQTIIKAGHQWPALSALLLERNNISCEGLEGIQKVDWKNMKKIDLTKNHIKTKGFSYLVQANWPELQCLDLSHSEIGLQGALKFPLSNWPNLQMLYLNYNMIGCEGLRQLSKCNLKQLRVLELSNNRLEAKSMAYLSSMELPNLKHLTLNRNFIGKDKGVLSEIGCVYLSKIKVEGLKSLRIFGNQITINGIKLIIYSGKLAQNCFLQILRNHFTFSDIQEDIKICKIFSNQF